MRVLPFLVACATACAAQIPEDQASTAATTGETPAAFPSGDFNVAGSYPIVLHHGFNASPDSDWGWNDRVKSALEQRGHTVFISQVNPYNSPAVRAPELATFLEDVLAQTGAPKVHLIAHSQGGLDARYLVSPAGLNRADLVRSITTISTPHHGTFIADAAGGFIEAVSDQADVHTAMLQAGASPASVLARIMAHPLNPQAQQYDFDLVAALGSMAESRIEDELNATLVDSPDVYYQSFAGVSNLHAITNPLDLDACAVNPADEAVGTLQRLHDGVRDDMTTTLIPVAAFVAHGQRLYPNDGVVRVASARWGRFRGCLLADHMGEVGQGNEAGLVDSRTGFDLYAFYAQTAAELVELE